MNIQSFFFAPEAVYMLLPILALKAAATLGAAGAITLALRRASAAARHLAWLLAILCVLILPLLSITTPPLHLRTQIPSAAPTDIDHAAKHFRATIAPAIGVTPPTQDVPAAFDRRPLFLMAAWAVVTFATLLRLAVGLILAYHVTRRCRRVTDPLMLGEMRRLTESLGLRRSVDLRQGDGVAAPMTMGVIRPVILLPGDAGVWPSERLEAAIRHELAHIVRRDWVWHMLAGVMCALHWFNPLAWWAARRLRAESERACDDAVLAGGSAPAEYASHLLEIARSLSTSGIPVPGAVVGMAHRPEVEGRLRAILHARVNRRAPTRLRVFVAVSAAALILGPVAAVRTAAQDEAQQKARADAERLNSLSNLRQIGLACIMYAAAHDGKLPDADRWVDEIAPMLSQGDPRFLLSLMRDPSAPASEPYGYAFNKALSGIDLRKIKEPSQVVMVFESTIGTRNAADAGASIPVPGRHEGGTHYVFADGRARWVADGGAVSFTLTSNALKPEQQGPMGKGAFTGRVVYDDGRPAAGVRVGAQIQNDASIVFLEAAEGHHMISNGLVLPLLPGEKRPTNEELRRIDGGDTITGRDGRYRLIGMTDAPYNIAVLPLDLKVVNDQDPWVAKAIEGARGAEGVTVALPDLMLTHGGVVTGHVTDAAGKPIQGTSVGSYGPHRPQSSAMIISALTDANGRYQLRVAPGESFIYLPDDRWKSTPVTLIVAKGETKTADFQARKL